MRVIDYFDKGAALDPDHLLLVSDEAAVSYGEAQANSWAVARSLYARGFALGDTVGVLRRTRRRAFSRCSACGGPAASGRR